MQNCQNVEQECFALDSLHNLSLRGRKAYLCFFGCKLLDTMMEELVELNTAQLTELSLFLYREGFVVPVMKYVCCFSQTTGNGYFPPPQSYCYHIYISQHNLLPQFCTGLVWTSGR